MSDPGFTPDNNIPAGLTPDDHVDNSKWQTFLKDEFANFDNPDLMLKQMMGDLIDLKNARPHEKCQGEISLDAFMAEAYEIEDMKKEVF